MTTMTTINEVKNHLHIHQPGKLALLSPSETLHMIFDVEKALAGFKEYDYDLIEASCMAVAELRYDSVHEGPKDTMELYGMVARLGYGPMMFLVAMQKSEELSGGMVPHTSPHYVTDAASKMIESFYSGANTVYTMGYEYEGRHSKDHLNFVYQSASHVDLSTMEENLMGVLQYSDGTYMEYMWEAGESWLTNAMRDIYHVT